MRENKALDNSKRNTDMIQQQQNHIKENTKGDSPYREVIEIPKENKSNRKYGGKYKC